MARYLGPKCKLCRREGMKLFLKGARCESPKCAVAKRGTPPGQHPFKRGKQSEFGHQLREKQKARRTFGVLERQFRRILDVAMRTKGNTGETLVSLLERRLDNAVYLLGFGQSRYHARQLVIHGHVRVNGKRVRRPSYVIGKGDTITPGTREKSQKVIRDTVETTKHRNVPSWLSVNEKALEGKVIELPKRDEVSVPIEDQLIVEFCSK